MSYLLSAQREIQRLRDRCEELEGLLGMQTRFPRAFGLTPGEARIMGLLLASPCLVSREGFMVALYGGLGEHNDKIIDVFLAKIRPKLRPYGITIRRSHGTGWYLSPADKASLRDLTKRFEQQFTSPDPVSVPETPGAVHDVATVQAAPGNNSACENA